MDLPPSFPVDSLVGSFLMFGSLPIFAWISFVVQFRQWIIVDAAKADADDENEARGGVEVAAEAATTGGIVNTAPMRISTFPHGTSKWLLLA